MAEISSVPEEATSLRTSGPVTALDTSYSWNKPAVHPDVPYLWLGSAMSLTVVS